MGSREPCRRLEAVLGALYDLGEEPGARGIAEDNEVSTGAAAAAETREPQPAAGGAESAISSGSCGPSWAPPSHRPAAPPAVEVVVFRGRKRKGRPSPSSAPTGGAQTKIADEEKNANEQEFNFEKLVWKCTSLESLATRSRNSVYGNRSVLSCWEPSPQKEHVNYKTYQEKMKEKKTAKDDEKGKEHKGDSLKKKKKDQKERKAKRKKSVPSIWPAGQVGKFRDGTLILQSYDIKKIKSSKVIK